MTLPMWDGVFVSVTRMLHNSRSYETQYTRSDRGAFFWWLGLTEICLFPWWRRVGDWVLEWFEDHCLNRAYSMKMWLMISLLGLISVCWGDGEGVCRESESTLFCVGRWDGIRREGIEKLIIREWDRRWCGEELWEKALIYAFLTAITEAWNMERRTRQINKTRLTDSK